MKIFGQKKRANPRRPHYGEKPKVYSYSSARSARERPFNRGEEKVKAPADAPPKRITRVINWLILLFVLGSALYLTVLQPDAQVKVSGEKVYPREKNVYETKIDEILSRSLFNRNKLTFDETKLSAEVRREFPEINTIKVSVPVVRHRPTVEVTLAKPAAKLVTKDKTYILDSEGRALFDEAQAASSLNTSALLTINDASGHGMTLGKPALTQAQIGYINEVIGQTTAKGLKPRSFALSEGGTAVDVKFEDIGYFVKFSFYADARQSSGAFIALHEQFAQGPKPQQYVDLRIPDKAFIR